MRTGASAADNYEPDEVGTRILVLISHHRDGVTQDDLRGILRLHNERVRLYLSELEEHEFVYTIWAGIADAPIKYYLREKASRFLVEKNLI